MNVGSLFKKLQTESVDSLRKEWADSDQLHSVIHTIIRGLNAGQELTPELAGKVIQAIPKEQLNSGEIPLFLTALRTHHCFLVRQGNESKISQHFIDLFTTALKEENYSLAIELLECIPVEELSKESVRKQFPTALITRKIAWGMVKHEAENVRPTPNETKISLDTLKRIYLLTTQTGEGAIQNHADWATFAFDQLVSGNDRLVLAMMDCNLESVFIGSRIFDEACEVNHPEPRKGRREKLKEAIFQKVLEKGTPSKTKEQFLIRAALNGEARMVHELLNQGVNPNVVDRGGMNTPIIGALLRLHTAVVKELLSSNKLDLNFNLISGTSLLHMAIALKEPVEIIEMILKRGVDLNSEENVAWISPLSTSVIGMLKGLPDIINAAVQLKAPIEAIEMALEMSIVEESKENSELATPLFTAIQDLPQAVPLLIQYGADPNRPNKNKKTPLHIAAENNDPEIIADLVKGGAKLEVQDGNGLTPLYIACQKGHVPVIKQLIKAGADPLAKDLEDNTVFEWTDLSAEALSAIAIYSKSPITNLRSHLAPQITEEKWKKMVEYAASDKELSLEQARRLYSLMPAGNKGALDTFWGESTQKALRAGHPGMTRFLIETNLALAIKHCYETLFDSEIRKIPESTQIPEAAQMLEEIVNRTLASTSDEVKKDLLFEVIVTGEIEIVKKLLKAGVSPNRIRKTGDKDQGDAIPIYHALLFSRFYSHMDVVKELLNHKDFDFPMLFGRERILNLFFKRASPEVVEILFKHGLDVGRRTKYDKETCLHIASEFGNAALIPLLLKQGAKLDSKDIHGLSPLHSALKFGAQIAHNRGAQLEMVKTLLQQKADIEAQDDQGQTPLMLACKNKQFLAVNLLLQQGANILAKDTLGKTLFQTEGLDEQVLFTLAVHGLDQGKITLNDLPMTPALQFLAQMTELERKELIFLIKDKLGITTNNFLLAYLLPPQHFQELAQNKQFQEALIKGVAIENLISLYLDYLRQEGKQKKAIEELSQHLLKRIEAEVARGQMELSTYVLQSLFAFYPLLGLPSDGPVFHQMCKAGLALHLTETSSRNRYLVADHQLTERKKEIVPTLPIENIGGSLIQVNLDEFKRCRQITVKELKERCPHVTSNTWNELVGDFEKRIGNVDLKETDQQTKESLTPIQRTLFAEIENTTELGVRGFIVTKETIQDPKGYISALCKISADPDATLSTFQLYFFDLIEYLQKQSNERVPPAVLSPREEILITWIHQIQACPGGKAEMIVQIHHSLVREGKIQPLVTLSNPLEKDVNKIRMENKVRITVEKMITETFAKESPLLREVTGVEEDIYHLDKIDQVVHQSLFIKNLIGPEIGISGFHFEEFPHSLYLFLVYPEGEENQMRSKRLTLDQFWSFHKPKMITTYVKDELNRQLIEEQKTEYLHAGKKREKKEEEATLFADLQAYLGGQDLGECLEEKEIEIEVINPTTQQKRKEEITVYVLTELGSLALLKKANYLKEFVPNIHTIV